MLFADIVGSTGYTGSREPEVVRSELKAAFERTRRVLEDHGGTVEKFIGDAVMCVFGVPAAHDDDAERALRAALAMRDEFAAKGMRLRVGVNTGEVVSGDAAAGEPLVTGQAVIAAARLQESAAPGEILAGPLTMRITRDAVRFGEMRTIKAKNMDVQGAAVLGLASSVPGAERAGRAPFVGRDDELDLLRSVMRRTAGERKGHIVTILGEAGVGKTRLVAEFLADLGAPSLRGRCLPYGRSITFWPLREMLARAARIEAADAAPAARQKLRALVATIEGPGEAERDLLTRALSAAIGLETAGEAYPTVDEIVTAVRRFLEERAQRDPLVIVIEDIHWAETAFLDLVEQLNAHVRAPLIIVCVARPELFERRPDWGAGRVNATTLTLQPLTREETLELARALLAAAGLPEVMASGIVARTEGNPLYVEEVVRTLAEGDEPGNVPATLQGIVTARLDRLLPQVRVMLRRASVQGRDFTSETLDALGDDPAGRDARLDLAVERDFVAERSQRGPQGGRSFRFRHVIIRDVVYGTIAKTDRWRLHLDLARWMGHSANAAEDVAAFHLEQAYQLAREVSAPEAPSLGREAFTALREAGSQARVRQDFAAALDLYQRARAVGIGAGVSDADLLDVDASAAIGRLRLDPTPEAVSAFDGTLAKVREAGSSELLVRLLTWRVAIATGRSLTEMRAYLSELVAVARQTGDTGSIAQALWLSHEPDWLAGDLVADRAILEDALSYAREQRAVFAMISCLCDLATNAIDDGDLDRAGRHLADAEGPSQLRGASLDRFKVLAGQCELALARGELERAHELARDARHLARAIGGPWAAVRSATLLADALRARGDRAGSRDLMVEELRALHAVRSAEDTIPHLLWRLVRAEAEAGDIAAARRYLADLRSGALSDVRLRARAHAVAADLARAGGAHTEAESELRAALALLEGTGCRRLRAELQSDLDRASAHVG